MKTTRTTVFLSLAILASFLFAASAALADITYTNSSMPGETLVTGSGEGGVGNVTFNITGTNPVYYEGIISGAGSITKTGNGELAFSGASSDYSGTVNVNTGMLTLGKEGRLAGSVSINNESVFKCGATYSEITNLTVNGGTFMVGVESNTAATYLSDFTLSSGYVEFDVNTFVSGASGMDLDLDYLYVNNGVLNNGAISLWFRNNDEMAWHDGAPDEGYQIIDAGADLTFNENAIKIYADGQQTDNWYLTQVGNSIYLKPKSSQPDPPTPADPWYYANSPTDLSASSWAMNKNPKIGVKFLDGNATATYDSTKSITMTKNGDFEYGEYQIGEGHALTIEAKISGNADLKKTGAGELILSADNDFSGNTYIEEGTLTLIKPNPATDHKGTLAGGTTITVDGLKNMNDSSRAKSILNGQGDIFGNRASSGENATSIGKIRLINGGILQNNSTNNHITVSCVVEMENGVIQLKETGAGTDAGNFLFDNAIHVLSGQNNLISARAFSIRHHDYATYAEGEDAGYFYVEDGAALTITSEIKSYGAQTIPFVKTGKGELILNNYSDSEICRFTNLNGDFIVREGKVISNKKKDPQSTFGKGAVIVEKDGWLECRVSNQFGYENTVQKDITVYGTLKPSTNTHMHELNLIGGTVETEYVTSASGDGLDFHNRAGKITSSGESIIKSKVTSGKSGNPGTMQIDVTDGNLTITGLVVGTSPFTKTGAGTLTLTNTMSNSFTINNGALVAGNEVALGTGAVTIGGTDNAVGQLTIGASSTEPLDLTVGGKVTLSGGQINFDFTADDFDTLIATNGFEFTTDTTGKFNLNFAAGNEATWYENAPEAGYKIVSISNGYTGPEDLTSYLSGRTQPWTLTATSDGIYLGQAEDPSSLYWNPIADDGKNWSIDGTEKIGVKYNDESNEGDPKTKSHDENITLDSDGVFIIGDEYAFEQVGPISGDGDLTKTEGGTLVLSGDNTYTGDTIVSGGTLELNKDNAIATSGSVTNNATIESTGDQTLNNLAGTNPEAEIKANDGDLTLYSGDNAITQYDGKISGNAKVKKTGFGSLLFTGENSYTGGTEVDAGSLVLLTDETSDGTAGVGPIEVAENGELVYNVAAGKTKKIDNAITGAGTITKTGAGKLQAHPTNDMPLQAGSFNVKQGEFDLLGEFEGDLNVGPLNEDGTEVGNKAAVFSPGNSVGDATVYGDVNIDAKATGLFEFGAYSNDPAARFFDTLTIVGNDSKFTISDEAAIKLSFLAGDAAAWAEDGAEYQLVYDQGFADGDYNYLLANYNDFFDLVGQNGDGLYLIGRGAPEGGSGVPEPSTWALLLLGVAGLYWMRRRK